MALGFSTALEALKDGHRVARDGWNGKGMWLALVPGNGYEIFDMPNEEAYQQVGVNLSLTALPWIGMRTADGGFVPWLASQTDLLANDWGVLHEVQS